MTLSNVDLFHCLTNVFHLFASVSFRVVVAEEGVCRFLRVFIQKQIQLRKEKKKLQMLQGPLGSVYKIQQLVFT